MATYDDFQKLDIRIGKITKVEDFPAARKPSYKMQIDLGEEVGTKQSCGQYVAVYPTKEELEGKFVACVVNFPPMRMGSELSEVLTLGFPNEEGHAVLVTVDKNIPLGGKLF